MQMKRYGFKFPQLDGHGATYLEHRALGLIAALVLGLLFSEPWLYLLGFVFFALGYLAETCGEKPILISAIVPISCLLWFISAIVSFEQVFPASIIYAVICTALVVDSLSENSESDQQ